MQARVLRKILKDTKYIIADYGSYIAVGSTMVHGLLKVDKATLNLTYALDTFRKGRAALKHPELEFIWDTLSALIDSGEIKAIIEGVDEIANPLPVFTYEKGHIIESVTDKYGWPNTDREGRLMYDNTFFPTRAQAVEAAIEQQEAILCSLDRRREELDAERAKFDKYMAEQRWFLEAYKRR